MNNKILVTAGCSFSECFNWYLHHDQEKPTWPIFLKERLSNIEHYSEAMGSQGNGLISRRTQYRVSKLLQTHAAKDLLVGIMWSGRNRFDFYFDQPVELTTNTDNWMQNPTKVVNDAPGGWVICNAHWTHPYNNPWYKYYYNDVAAQIYTLEHIMNTQNFLKLHGVNYFMTSAFASHQSGPLDNSFKDNANCSWLWDQVDWSKWLPVNSEFEWVNENCPNLLLHHPRTGEKIDRYHPTPDQHEKFVDQVILPWLTDHNMI
jgi:hypothetical protein